MPSFKVGDRVKVNENYPVGYDDPTDVDPVDIILRGLTGTVADTEVYYTVDFDAPIILGDELVDSGLFEWEELDRI
jgi:hypothetical protein